MKPPRSSANCFPPSRRLNKKFGVGVVADVLAGAETERTQRFSSLSVYGLLKNFGSKRIIAMLHRLMESGLARQRDPDGVKFRPVVEITAAGVAVMKGDVPPPATLADITPTRREASRAVPGFERRESRRQSPAEDDGFQADPEASARFAKLRAVRLGIAKDKGLPPYVICHDSVLKAIAMSMPANLEALKSIKGMGPYKVQTYGQTLLDAVRD